MNQTDQVKDYVQRKQVDLTVFFCLAVLHAPVFLYHFTKEKQAMLLVGVSGMVVFVVYLYKKIIWEIEKIHDIHIAHMTTILEKSNEENTGKKA